MIFKKVILEKRLCSLNQKYILFRNGYGQNRPTIKCKVTLKIGKGKKEWGAEINKTYYILNILEVERVS